MGRTFILTSDNIYGTNISSNTDGSTFSQKNLLQKISEFSLWLNLAAKMALLFVQLRIGGVQYKHNAIGKCKPCI